MIMIAIARMYGTGVPSIMAPACILIFNASYLHNYNYKEFEERRRQQHSI
jgi:hypothetical protein